MPNLMPNLMPNPQNPLQKQFSIVLKPQKRTDRSQQINKKELTSKGINSTI